MTIQDPDEKSEKTLKTEELEVLVRLLNTNLEGLRYLRREPSTADDVALNNRLLTARISALSGLITFVSQGEIAQMRGLNLFSMDGDNLNDPVANSNVRLKDQDLNPDSPSMPEENKSRVHDEDDDDRDEFDSESDDDDDDDANDNDSVYSSGTDTFQSIRPFMEVLRAGIRNIASTSTSTIRSPPINPPPNDNENPIRTQHLDLPHPSSCSSSTTTSMRIPSMFPSINRSEYERRDISSIDNKRRPVLGVPAPIAHVPRGAIRGGGEPKSGNLKDLKRNRKSVFLSWASAKLALGPVTTTSVSPQTAGSSESDLMDSSEVSEDLNVVLGPDNVPPKKRHLEEVEEGACDREDHEQEEDFDDGNLLLGYKRQRVSGSSSDSPTRPTRTGDRAQLVIRRQDMDTVTSSPRSIEVSSEANLMRNLPHPTSSTTELVSSHPVAHTQAETETEEASASPSSNEQHLTSSF